MQFCFRLPSSLPPRLFFPVWMCFFRSFSHFPLACPTDWLFSSLGSLIVFLLPIVCTPLFHLLPSCMSIRLFSSLCSLCFFFRLFALHFFIYFPLACLGSLIVFLLPIVCTPLFHLLPPSDCFPLCAHCVSFSDWLHSTFLFSSTFPFAIVHPIVFFSVLIVFSSDWLHSLLIVYSSDSLHSTFFHLLSLLQLSIGLERNGIGMRESGWWESDDANRARFDFFFYSLFLLSSLPFLSPFLPLSLLFLTESE